MRGALLPGFHSVVRGQQLTRHPKNVLETQSTVPGQDLLRTPGWVGGGGSVCCNEPSGDPDANHCGAAPAGAAAACMARTASQSSALAFARPSFASATRPPPEDGRRRRNSPDHRSGPGPAPHQPQAERRQRPDGRSRAHPCPAAGGAEPPRSASPREGRGSWAPITCTSVICEPSARRIFSVLVGYGLSRCLYSHCLRGRAMSCRACRLCLTFPPFCRALGHRERRGSR